MFARFRFEWLVGIAFYTFLIVYSGVYFKERSFGDASWQIFQLVNNGLPIVAHGRWIIFFTQIPATIGTVAGLGLKSIMILYTIGPIIFSFVFFGMSLIVIRSRMAAFSILFCTVFSVGDIFFELPDLEKHLFTSIFCFTAFFIVSGKWKKGWGILTMCALYFLMVRSHPMVWSVLILFPLYLALERKWLASLFSGLLTVLFIGIVLSDLDPYQSIEMNQRISIGQQIEFADYLYLIPENISLIAVLAIVVVALIRSKKYVFLQFLLVFVSVYMYVLLTRVDIAQFNPYLMPLAGLLSFLVFLLIQEKWIGPQGWIALASVILIDVGIIANHANAASHRANLMEVVIGKAKDQGIHRAVFDGGSMPSGLPESSYMYTESALFSSIDGPEGTVYCAPLEKSLEMAEQVAQYLPKDRLEKYFPRVNERDSLSMLATVEAVYKSEYYTEEYMDKPFSLWCYGNVNPRYFTTDTTQFQYLVP